MHALVEQNKRLVDAQSTPLLMLDTGNADAAGKPVISITISNVGTGPAQIAWFRIVDDQGTDFRGGSLYERVAKLDSHTKVNSQQVSGTLLRSGDMRSVFRWPKPVGSDLALAEWNKLNPLSARMRLHASACYCSIFDECRTTDFGESHPTPVTTCGNPQKP